MKQLLQSIGRVIEYEKCYQVVDASLISSRMLRKLNNHNVEIKQCRESLTGFQLVVQKQQIHNTVYVSVFISVTAAIALFLFWLL